jgi:pimeloyl-ACP methyl ester carboxylesterase
MPFVDAAGVQVHYTEHGPSEGRTVVLLHGFTPDHRLMTGCFEPVFACRPGWRRLYLDLPGMGRTSAPEHFASSDDVFETVLAAIDNLAPGPYVLAGESYGGYLARSLVAAHPERISGLALICPMVIAPHAERDVPLHQVLVQDEFCASLPADSEFAEVAVVQTKETYQRTQAEIVAGLEIADEAALDRIKQDWTGSLPKETDGTTYGRPTLFMLGRQDSSTGYRDAWALMDHYPRATVAVLDRAGHNAQIEQPELFGALVHEWLDRVEEGTPEGPLPR